MIRCEKRRAAAAIFAIIIISAILTAPLIECLGSHSHACSQSRCPICPVLKVLRDIGELCAVSLILLPFLSEKKICASIPHGGELALQNPIALKTKLIS